MEKNKQPAGAAIPIKGAMPHPQEKAGASPTPAKDMSEHKRDGKVDKTAHGKAHAPKK